eukprot:6185820-Pleurochrysis_carterae.AAC.1
MSSLRRSLEMRAVLNESRKWYSGSGVTMSSSTKPMIDTKRQPAGGVLNEQNCTPGDETDRRRCSRGVG